MQDNNENIREDEDIKEYQENNKLGFFKKLWYSITKIEKYPEMTTLGVKSSILYLFKLMAIFALILCLCLTIKTYFTVNNAVKYFENDFPNVSYKDGKVNVDSTDVIKYSEENSIFGEVIIDTNSEDEETINKYQQEINDKDSGIVILQDKLILKNPALSQLTEYKYKDILTSAGVDRSEITKQDILDFAKGDQIISLYTVFFAIIFIYILMIYFVSVLVDSLILAVIGYITAMLAKIKMRFLAIYNMAVYSLTLSIILNLIYLVVNVFTTFNIKYFQVMYTSVAFIYLVAAIFIIKSEFIKKQMELIKIVEEQKKVREELKNQENKDEQKKDEDKKEEKNDEDNKNEDNSDGPEGSEA